MTTFLHVLAIIGLILLGLALLAGVIFPPLEVMLDEAHPAALLISLASILGIALMITIGINSGAFNDDSASHCAEGTHYVSSYNNSTETTDWWCAAS
jgi:hypothetical protein